jgi:cephalosporin hydroxylase
VSIVNRVVNRLAGKIQRRLFGASSSDVGRFSSQYRPEFADQYKGKVAELFFGNTGPLAYKWLHYLPIYNDLLESYVGTRVKMLEIGVYQGGSLALWRRYFGERATIFGVDIDPDCAAFDGQYGQVRLGSQDDPAFLRRVVKEMGGVDVVLDDGSHIARHQRASFEAVFPLLSDGGLYIIEDLHTAYWWDYGGGLRRRGSAIEFLKARIDDMHAHYFKPGSDRRPRSDIESIQFFDSIAVVKKKKQLPRFNVKVGG